MDRGIAGAVATTGAPLNITDAYKDSRFNKVRRGRCEARRGASIGDAGWILQEGAGQKGECANWRSQFFF